MPEDEVVTHQWVWAIEIAIGIGIIIALSLFLKKIVSLFAKLSSKKEGVWAKKAHKIIHLPLQIAIWGFGVGYVLDVAGSHFGFPGIVPYVRRLRVAFLIVCFSWIVLRWIKEGFNHLAKRSAHLGVATSTMYALSKLTSFVFSIIVLMILFSIFNLNVLPLLTFGGIGVAGLAFAAQDIIANFFGGAMLHFTRNFSPGDQIIIPSQSNFEGIVKEIGWYITAIDDLDRRPVYFPNSLFSKTHVINTSRRTHRRIREEVVIRYDDMANLENIIKDLREKVGAHPDVDETQSFQISFTKFGDNGLHLFFFLLIYHMPFPEFLQVQQEVFLIVQDVLNKYGAEVAYPTMRVNLPPTH